MASPVVARVDGAKQLRRAMKKAGLDVKDLKRVHAQVGQIAGAASRGAAPVRTGRLKGTVRSSGTQTAAIVRAGRAAVPYAQPIHWGWRARNIAPNPWISEAAQRTEPAWFRVYQREVDDLLDKLADSTRGVR